MTSTKSFTAEDVRVISYGRVPLGLGDVTKKADGALIVRKEDRKSLHVVEVKPGQFRDAEGNTYAFAPGGPRRAANRPRPVAAAPKKEAAAVSTPPTPAPAKA